jgi:hypothetical protein
MTLPQAEKQLFAALAAGRIVAIAKNAAGHVVDIPQREWPYLRVFEEQEQDVLKYDPLDREPASEIAALLRVARTLTLIMLQKLNSAASSPAGPHYGSAALQLRTTVAAGKSFRLLRCLSCEKMSRIEELTSVFDDRAGVMDGDPRRRSHLLAVHGIGAASFQSPAELRHRDGRKPCRRTKTPSRIATGSLASSLGHSQPNARICSRRRTHAAGEAGLPHLPEGDLLLAWHAPNLPKNHPQPECGIWHRLTECQGRAVSSRSVVRRDARRPQLRRAMPPGFVAEAS